MYKVYYTYLAESVYEGKYFSAEFSCTEDVETFSDLQALLAELRENNCYDIWWSFADEDGERW